MSVAAIEGDAYRSGSGLCSLDLGLQVQWGVEIAAGVSRTATLHVVHAHCDRAVFIRGHGLGGVRKATLPRRALARAAEILAAHLQQKTAG